MKTTIELPDTLFADAKATAARRRTTLKAILESALRREIYRDKPGVSGNRCFFIDEHGLPVIESKDGGTVTSEKVYQMMEDLGV